MAKSTSRFVCQSCGSVFAKWTGRCESCGAWNSMVEEAAPAAAPGGLAKRSGRGGKAVDFVSLEGPAQVAARMASGIAELDRVCGGGLVPGSAILVGGDPGIGKSTLLLQSLGRMAGTASAAGATGATGAASATGATGDTSHPACAYISGEESVDQVRLRARRMGLEKSAVQLAAATSVRDISATLDRPDCPKVVVIDSIQTMYVDNLESAPGTVSQVRASAQELIRLAKARGMTLLLVGHVTKDGMIAGPKVLEHMVDAVLTFEGERGHQFRILRAVKNRFGPTDEIGVFEMSDGGLREVANPSELFLAERGGRQVSGAAVFAGLEGSRPLLVEIQALVCPSPLATPRRAVVGWDSGRLAMVLAVLEARCGMVLAGQEVYLNVAGGLRIAEPAADLAVAAALVSAASGNPVPEDHVIFGEIGLSGEVRPVGQQAVRLKEAQKLGFRGAYLPPRRQKEARGSGLKELRLEEISHLSDLVAIFSQNGR